MECPKCFSEMKPAKYAGYEIDRCTDCHGLWFNTEEFEVLAKDDWLAEYIDSGEPGDAGRAPDANSVECPECSVIMEQHVDENQPHIVYERCPNGCGVYFDAGEFKDFAHKSFWDKFKWRVDKAT